MACIPRVRIGRILAHDNLFIDFEAVRLRDLASFGLIRSISPTRGRTTRKTTQGRAGTRRGFILHIAHLLVRDRRSLSFSFVDW